MNSRGVSQLLIWFALLWFSLSMTASVLAAEYEVDGQIDQTLFKPDGSVQLDTKSKFTVYVKDCSWLIQSIILDAAGKPLTLNETACTNGQVIYSVGGRINKDAVHGGRNGAAALNHAYIYSNNVPVGQTDDYFVCHLWLMFASGCYFQNLSTNRLTPAYDSNASAIIHPDLKREAKWELVNGPGSLPNSIVYLDEHGNHTPNATYMATGVTNVGELKIPSGFVFEQRVGARFAPGSIALGESAPAYHIRKRAVATVTAVRPVCTRSELMPVASGITMVIDERQQATNATNVLHYKLQNGIQWVPVEQAKKLAIRPATPKSNPTKVKVVFFVVMVLPSLALLYFLVKTRR
jgi:hypothetical protein